MDMAKRIGSAFVVATLALGQLGCAVTGSAGQRSTYEQGSRSASPAAAHQPSSDSDVHLVVSGEGQSSALDEPLAQNDGQAITLGEVLDLLFRGHRVGVLEQLVVHRAARRAADQKVLPVG